MLCRLTMLSAATATMKMLLMLTSPLAIVEVAREGHGDALTVLGLALGAAALAQPETLGAARAVRRAAVGFALASSSHQPTACVFV